MALLGTRSSVLFLQAKVKCAGSRTSIFANGVPFLFGLRHRGLSPKTFCQSLPFSRCHGWDALQHCCCEGLFGELSTSIGSCESLTVIKSHSWWLYPLVYLFCKLWVCTIPATTDLDSSDDRFYASVSDDDGRRKPRGDFEEKPTQYLVFDKVSLHHRHECLYHYTSSRKYLRDWRPSSGASSRGIYGHGTHDARLLDQTCHVFRA